MFKGADGKPVLPYFDPKYDVGRAYHRSVLARFHQDVGRHL
jgi:hypothetical protein